MCFVVYNYKQMPIDHDLEEGNFLSVRQKQQLSEYINSDTYHCLAGSDMDSKSRSAEKGGFRNFLSRWLGV